jgi:hypothetical protein
LRLAIMFAGELMTLAHFSVSAATKWPNSATPPHLCERH